MSFKKWLFYLHLYTGLIAGGLLAFSGITGSLLVFSSELDLWLNSARLTSTPVANAVSMQSVEDKIRYTYPNERLAYILLPKSEQGIYEAVLEDSPLSSNGHNRRIYIDPYTGEIVASPLENDTLRWFLFYLHSELLYGEVGATLVGVGALLLLGLVVSGLLVWWPGCSRVFSSLKIPRRADGVKVAARLHKTVGVGSVLVLFIIALSGACLVFSNVAQRVIFWMTNASAQIMPQLSTAPGSARLTLDQILHIAQGALPNARITQISLPAKQNQVIRVRAISQSEISSPNGMSYLYINPYSGAIRQIEEFSSMDLGVQLYRLLFTLHIGHFGGMATRSLWLLAGITPAILLTTGVFVWYRRRAARVNTTTLYKGGGKTTLR